MKIGMNAPAVRVPCINKGQITFRSLPDLHDTQLPLCCLSNITEKDAWFLESQFPEFEQSGSILGVFYKQSNIEIKLGYSTIGGTKSSTLSRKTK